MSGLAIDIDDTLAETAVSCFTVIAEKYGIPEGMSLEKLVRQYRQPGQVPVWQTKEIQATIRSVLEDRDWLGQLPVVKGASQAVQYLHRYRPVAVYISSRFSRYQTLTQEWLDRHGFPPAPVTLRHPATIRLDWKLQVLARDYPGSWGLVDNELGFLPLDQHMYQGELFWFDRYQSVPTSITDARIHRFSSWREIQNYLLQ